MQRVAIAQLSRFAGRRLRDQAGVVVTAIRLPDFVADAVAGFDFFVPVVLGDSFDQSVERELGIFDRLLGSCCHVRTTYQYLPLFAVSPQ